MLHCSACIRTCIRSVFAELGNPPLLSTSSPSPPPLLLTRRLPPQSTWLRRGYTTKISLAGDVPAGGRASLPPTPSHVVEYNNANLKLELRWLKDPVRLADHTVKLLREGNTEKALEIVRLASKDVHCTVSWNHLIDYEMSKQRVSGAVKLYNEMKKRAQLPDAYTFTILFRGLSQYPHLSKSTARALSIYQSMFAENSPVRPSIIHTNAVLNVCARAHDIDALLGIAAELPIRGSRAPNKLTYTTVLNAIQSKASGEAECQEATSRKEKSERNKNLASAIQQGRRLWAEIRQRWLSGDLFLDEELVCAMGRLLLLSKEGQDDVLSLLKQTMGIPRQIARLATPALRKAAEACRTKDDAELPSGSPANVELETLLSLPKEEDNSSAPPGHPFAPLSGAAPPIQSAVRPGPNTLSLVLDACLRLSYVRAAQNYWGLLTSPDGQFRVIPDRENYHMYLRLLRRRRSSKLAVELVDDMRSGNLTDKTGYVQAKTFRIAMSCCVKDNKNRNSIVHAAKLVRMMTDTLPHPDAKALSMYLEAALKQKPRDWRVIMGVIRGTALGVRNLRSLVAYDPNGDRKQDRDDVLALVEGLIGAFNVVLDLGNEEIEDEEKQRCQEQKHTLVAYLTRIQTRYEQFKLDRKLYKERMMENERTDGELTRFEQNQGLRQGWRTVSGGFEGGMDEVEARTLSKRERAFMLRLDETAAGRGQRNASGDVAEVGRRSLVK